MASGHADAREGVEDRKLASQDEYEETVSERAWFESEDGWFQVETVRPMKLLRNAEKYGVLELIGGEGDEDAVQRAMTGGGFGMFMETTIAPNVVQPAAYWDEDAARDTPGFDADAAFDLASLEPEDLFGLIETMTQADQEELESRAETLRGNQ